MRASVAELAATGLIVVDRPGLLISPATSAELGAGLAVAAQRFVLFLVVPVAIVLFGFRDRLGRYGFRLGDWRLGAGLLVLGLIVMTPIIVGLSGLDAFRTYYGSAPRPLALAVVSNLVELIPAEFLLRGFLMFALWRRIGGLAIVVVQVPFVLTHIGKPEIEPWSTFVGGTVFAWLDWRTGSILWSALGHVYVLTLMLVAVGGATT
jgi:membrane protease YdiL (CAAX protease family)